MQLKEIRQKFLLYFESKGHHIVKSSSLLPHNDKTLLFTNAGMNQFKDLFLGDKQEIYTRACSTQKCVRAGGKHNDLENVGYTARHHTFFEMLGNFSFGDYFKLDAIRYAWEFLTRELLLPQDRLYVTVYMTDDESYDIWHNDIGLDNARIIRIGDKIGGGSDNFWQMGDTGPCGPCTEIFYDHGESVMGGLPGSVGEDGDRYVEIWNCVFMQFNRDEKGVLHKLPKPSVDTGMGLERISAVMQGVCSNYQIDLFVKLIDIISLITNTQDKNTPSLKVIADHIRAISFLIADGILPSNEGRGYVLRRILRRAIRHGYKLGIKTPFLTKIVPTLIIEMGDDYPELKHNQKVIIDNIMNEEEKFFATIDNGMNLLQLELNHRKTDDLLSGEVAFKLYDTYGFPLDLTEDICREYNIKIDYEKFNTLMEQQKQLARSTAYFNQVEQIDYNGDDTLFNGYTNQSVNAVVVAIFNQNSQRVDALHNGDAGIIILDNSCFYAESGGQVGDSGVISINDGRDLLALVNNTKYLKNKVIGHFVTITKGMVKVFDKVIATFDFNKRQAIKRNHSVTHLLHKALQVVLGENATQKGSLVNETLTRFDFAQNKPLTRTQIEQVESIVNNVIMQNYPVSIKNASYDNAIKSGVSALFGEKYGDIVRVVSMGEFSFELCGGTHVERTGDIGYFTITGESGVANGIRRIEAITGEESLRRIQKNCAILDDMRLLLKAPNNDNILEKLHNILEINKKFIKEIDLFQQKLSKYQANDYLDDVKLLANGVKFLVINVDALEHKQVLNIIDNLKIKLSNTVIIAILKTNIMIAITKDLLTKISANDLIKKLIVGGIEVKGGGRPELAIFNFKHDQNLDKLINTIENLIINWVAF